MGVNERICVIGITLVLIMQWHFWHMTLQMTCTVIRLLSGSYIVTHFFFTERACLVVKHTQIMVIFTAINDFEVDIFKNTLNLSPDNKVHGANMGPT